MGFGDFIGDRFRRAIDRLVRSSLRRLDYLPVYPAKIVAQSSDGKTVDVMPDDVTLFGARGLAGVPLLGGLPGLVQKVRPGARVVLGFRAGKPSDVVAYPAWEGGEDVASIQLDADLITLNTQSPKRAARCGDKVKVTIPINALLLAVSGGNATGPAAPVTLEGTIVEGTAGVKLGGTVESCEAMS